MDTMVRRACIFNFLSFQQKVKRKVPLHLCDPNEVGGESVSKKY